MNKKILAILIGAIIIIASVSAIYWQTSTSNSNTNKSTPQTITITDLANRTVTLTVPVTTVVLGDTEATNAFVAVAGDDFMGNLKGVCSSLKTNYPDLYSAYVKEYPSFADITEVGDFEASTFSIETVITLNPDVLILPLWTKIYGMEPDLSALDAADIPYVYIDFYLDPYGGETYEKSVNLLGTLLGEENRASQIIDFYTEQVDTVFNKLATLSNDTTAPTVYIEYPTAGTSTYGMTMVHSGMSLPIDYACGDNIAEGTITRSGTINGEFLIAQDPDIILFCICPALGSASGGDLVGFNAHPTTEQKQALLSEYLQRPGWTDLSAVKNGKVYFWYSGLSFSIENFAILQNMAKWFYPTQFADLNPDANIQEFYTKFMPITFDGTWTFSSTV
jgi:iron complex transport system substrate-binding protein